MTREVAVSYPLEGAGAWHGARADELPLSAPKALPRRGGHVSADIAVIDDEPAVLQMIQDFLQIEGYSSVGADATSIDALTAAGEKPRLFLIDLMLGETSGIEVAQRLHAAGFGDVPMLAVSASRAFLQLASESGLFQDVVYKPFDLADLRGRIERQLGVQGTASSGV